MSARLGFEELARNVIERGVCTGCGACVISCPYKSVLEYSAEPKIIGECKVCSICPRVCPRYVVQRDDLERFFFGRTRKPEEDFGIFREIWAAKSNNYETLKICQDGGIATELINSALDSGIIDGAIISGLNHSIPWFPEPFVATRRRDILRYAGTRYTYSPNLLAFVKCIAHGLKKIAFVGTPCQILAFRRIQKIPLKKISSIVAFTIGLFCSESFTYEGLMIKKIHDKMGIDLHNLKKINIKGNMLLTLKNGKIVEIPLKEVKDYTEEKCRYCSDFSAELADISLGGVGLTGRTFAVIRTEQGDKIFNQAIDEEALNIRPAKEFTQAYNLLVRLSKIKRRKVKKIDVVIRE